MLRRFWTVLIAVAIFAIGCTGPASPASPSGGSAAPIGSGGAKTGFAVIGMPAMSVGYVPTFMAVDRLNALGYDVRVVNFDSSATLVAAGQSGEVDIVDSAASGQMTAMDGGYAYRFFLGDLANEFALVGKAEYTDCNSLDGKVVGYHSQVSTDGLLTKDWIQTTCTSGTPKELVVSGSDNRLIALLENQVDAATLGISDWLALDLKEPGKFKILAPYYQDAPLYSSTYAADPTWINENQEMIKDFIREQLAVFKEIYASPDVLKAKAKELLPQVEPAVLDSQVDAYLAAKYWTDDGGLNEDVMNSTLKLASDGVEGGFTTLKTFADVGDRTLLDAVLGE